MTRSGCTRVDGDRLVYPAPGVKITVLLEQRGGAGLDDAEIAEAEAFDEEMLCYFLAVPGSPWAGPYDPVGAPYGRRGHGRLRRPCIQISGRGEGVKNFGLAERPTTNLAKHFSLWFLWPGLRTVA